MTTMNLGKIRPTDKGVWTAGYESGYDILDIVTSGKGSYMSKKKDNTDAVSNRNSWIPLVDSDAIDQAIQEANTATQKADQARLAIEGDLALKVDQIELDQLAGDVKETAEKPAAQSLSELNARITALEAILSNKIKDRIDVTKEFNVWGKTNLILYGDGANTKAPDFIGQKYIDTTNSNVYVAVGNSNAGNWKLV